MKIYISLMRPSKNRDYNVLKFWFHDVWSWLTVCVCLFYIFVCFHFFATEHNSLCNLNHKPQSTVSSNNQIIVLEKGYDKTQGCSLYYYLIQNISEFYSSLILWMVVVFTVTHLQAIHNNKLIIRVYDNNQQSLISW